MHFHGCFAVIIRDPGQRDMHSGLQDPADIDMPREIGAGITAWRRDRREVDRHRAGWCRGEAAVETSCRRLGVVVLVKIKRDSTRAVRESWDVHTRGFQIRPVATAWVHRYLCRAEAGDTAAKQIEE